MDDQQRSDFNDTRVGAQLIAQGQDAELAQVPTLNQAMDRFREQTEHLRSLTHRLGNLVDHLEGDQPKAVEEIPQLEAHSILSAMQGNLEINQQLLDRASDRILALERHL